MTIALTISTSDKAEVIHHLRKLADSLEEFALKYPDYIMVSDTGEEIGKAIIKWD